MQRGKAAAQCSHATLGAYKRALKQKPNYVKKWERGGQKKITVQIPNEETLYALFFFLALPRAAYTKDRMQVQENAKRAGFPCYVVADAGRTQVAEGSLTVVAVGPGNVPQTRTRSDPNPVAAPSAEVDKITRQFKLY
jgi:PTH2 family peptidyl-tRNA hydrolase